jgi:hypothetical protein
MTKNQLICGLVVGGIAVLRQASILGLALALTMSGRISAVKADEETVLPPPSATQLLPGALPGVVLMRTAMAEWAGLPPLADFGVLPRPFDAKSVPFFPGLVLPKEISYSDDILPWIGAEVAIALLPAESTKETFDSNAVVIAPIAQADRVGGFLEKLKTLRGQPQERTYNGVAILEWAQPPKVEPSPEVTPTPGESPSPDQIPSPAPSLPPSPEASPSPTPQPSASPAPVPSPTTPLINQLWEATPFFQTWQDMELQSTELSQNRNRRALPPPPPPRQRIPRSRPVPSKPEPEVPPEKRPLAIAQVSGHLVAAVEGRAIEKLIAAQASIQPLATDPLFQRTWTKPQTQRSLIVAYSNFSAAAQSLSLLATEKPFPLLPVPLPPPDPEQVQVLTKTYNSADMHLYPQVEGLRLQVAGYYTEPKPQPDSTQFAVNQIARRLPANTYLSVNSQNLDQQLQELSENSETIEASRQTLDRFRTAIKAVTGLDLDTDIRPWLKGEYAMFIYPTTGGVFNTFHPRLNVGTGLLLQTSDRAATEAALKKFHQYFQTSVGKTGRLSTSRLNSQPVTSLDFVDLRTKRTTSVLAHTWLDDSTLAIASGTGALATLVPKPYQPLNLNYTYQTATTSLPSTNHGYFYMNMGSSLSFLYGLILPAVPDAATTAVVQDYQRRLGRIRSISTANSRYVDRQQFDVLVVMSKP